MGRRIKNFSINNNDILPISGIHLEFDNINKPSWIVLDLIIIIKLMIMINSFILTQMVNIT